MRPELAGLQIDDPPEPWARLGFGLGPDGLIVGKIRIVLAGDGAGITAWTLRGLESAPAEIDGLSTSMTSGPAPPDAVHPNGVLGLDHLVVVTPDFDRTSAALDAAGLGLRRVREAPGGFRQGFRRLGPAILEIVEAASAPAGGARFWGLTFVAADLEALAGRLGSDLGEIRPAVQAGRRIAPLARSAGVSPRVAFMDPE